MDFGPLLIFIAYFFSIGLIRDTEEMHLKDSNCNECGYALHHGVNEMIINGQPVTPTNKYPWMVAIMSEEAGGQFCGGAIISQHFVLSAAHCFMKVEGELKSNTRRQHSKRRFSSDLPFDDMRIGLLTNTKEIQPGPAVKKVSSHPKFKPFKGFLYDIAVLHLEEPIKCSQFARPICLPGTNINKIRNGDMFAIAGWGSHTGSFKDHSDTLLEAHLVHVASKHCKVKKIKEKTDKLWHCLKGHKGESPCYGDSGGPMFKQYGERYYVTGVTSNGAKTSKGHPCDSTKGVVVYTSVKPFMPWIKRITGLSGTQASKSLTSRRRRNRKHRRKSGRGKNRKRKQWKG